METQTCQPSAGMLQRKQPNDAVNGGVREPPPYPGHHHKLWKQSASYSTSSETSTDISMSSLESLSTSARQEPQGEETADLDPLLMDGGGDDVLSSASSSLSNVFSDDSELKLTSPSPMSSTTDDSSAKPTSWTTTSTSTSNPTSADLLKSTKSYFGSELSPNVSVCAPNSLIRQLLQTSPQYHHLLADLEPLLYKPVLRTTEKQESRCLPSTPSSSRSVTSLPKMNGSPVMSAASRRIINSYVNVDDDKVTHTSSSQQHQQQQISGRTYRDRQRPSTAPTEHSTTQTTLTTPTEAPAAPLKRIQTPTDPVDRQRSFEVLDRVSGATLPRSSTNTSVSDVISTARTQSGHRRHRHQQLQQEAINSQQNSSQHHHQKQHQQQQLQHQSSPSQRPHQRCPTSSPSQQQQHQQQQQPPMRISPQKSQNDEQKLANTSVPSSSSASLCVEQQQQQTCCSSADSQRASPQNACAHAAIATRATQMVERLSEENRSLRQELKDYYKKVSKLEKVERNIQNVSNAYETLAQHSQKREHLEKLMRMKLDAEVNRLTELNQQVQDHLERSLLQLKNNQNFGSSDSELKAELRRKDVLIARFIAENRELTTAKLQLESDLGSQRAAVQQSHYRIELLENAIAKQALSNHRQLVRQRSSSSEKQSLSLSQMSLSTTEADMDTEVETADGQPPLDVDFQQSLKYQQCDTDDGISSDSESPTSIHSLIRQMQDKERHIRQLETEVARWEQKFLEEAIFRQLAVDAISIPKDAKIAALVRNSVDTDKVLAESRLEKLAYMKELHIANERCAHLEAKMKNMQADLAERDSLIRVLQHHSSLSRASSISSLLASSSPLHSPHAPSSIIFNGSKPSSGASSRQGSQLSAGSFTLTKNGKFGGSTVTSGHYILPDNVSIYSHSIQQKLAVSEPIATTCCNSDQLHQCFWQV